MILISSQWSRSLRAVPYTRRNLMRNILLGCALLTLSGCGDLEVTTTKIISKSDLTTMTSVYVVEVDGDRYVIVNGTDKVAICR